MLILSILFNLNVSKIDNKAVHLLSQRKCSAAQMKKSVAGFGLQNGWLLGYLKLTGATAMES